MLDFALYYYDIISERVVTYTSATYNRKVSKRYKNHFGRFYYKDVPKDGFYLGVRLIEENGYSYLISYIQ